MSDTTIFTFDIRILRYAAVGAVLFAFGACDLAVDNPNEPDRDRALSNPEDVTSVIRSQWLTYWGVAQGDIGDEGSPGAALDAAAEVEASSSANDGTQDMGEMPPTLVVNEVGYRFSSWLRTPWERINRGLATMRSALVSIEEQDLDISEPQRVQAFAKFMQGLFHGYIALMYDRGYILDEEMDDVGQAELQSYSAVMDAARRYLEEARTIAQESDFTIPGGWLGQTAYSSEELVRLAHSYEARFMTAVARSPDERSSVNWEEVVNHVNAGIQEDFGVELDGFGGLWNAPYKARSSRTNSLFLSLIGPTDQSGKYLEWENTRARNRQPFLIDTDDRRITNGTPEGEGKYAEYRPFFNNSITRGSWFLSNYSPKWWRDISDTGTGFAPEITVEEMEFLKAEAHIRQGNPEKALPLINDERTEKGELPPATENGVSGERCVPRAVGPLAKASDLEEGDCADLMTTLIYEKRIELGQLSAGLSFFDARGFGILRTGRPIHMPIPASELQLIEGESLYTFGGGGEGSAP